MYSKTNGWKVIWLFKCRNCKRFINKMIWCKYNFFWKKLALQHSSVFLFSKIFKSAASVVYSATIMMQMRQEVIGSRRESSAGLGKGRRRGSAVGSRRSRKVIKYSKPVNWSSVFPFLLTIRSEKKQNNKKQKTKTSTSGTVGVK